MSPPSWTPVVIAAGAALLTAFAGARLTVLDEWYYRLRQPPWKPPDWLFGPAWTLIFTLAATAAVLSWRAAADDGTRAWLLILFGLNIGLNIAWSWLFFRRRRPDWALREIVLLWLSIAALMIYLAPLSALAAWLLTPYIAWVSFAAVLNRAIVQRNPASAG